MFYFRTPQITRLALTFLLVLFPPKGWHRFHKCNKNIRYSLHRNGSLWIRKCVCVCVYIHI